MNIGGLSTTTPKKIALRGLFRHALFSILFGTCLVLPTKASPVTYTFSGVLGGPDAGLQEEFTYIAPGFITTATFVQSTSFLTCLNCGAGVSFEPDTVISVFPDVPLATLIAFPNASAPHFNPREYFFAPANALAIAGKYDSFVPVEISLAGTGTLTVSPAPEPWSMITVLPILIMSSCWYFVKRSKRNERF